VPSARCGENSPNDIFFKACSIGRKLTGFRGSYWLRWSSRSDVVREHHLVVISGFSDLSSDFIFLQVVSQCHYCFGELVLWLLFSS
jgi:hypothetical protein